MKVSEAWLRDWANPPVDSQALGDKLTALGLELESITPLHNDQVIELGITPNRGDCLSVLGIAREISVGFNVPLHRPTINPIEVTLNERLPVEIKAPQACPRYSGRIIRAVDLARPTPTWMRDRLEKGGMQSVNAVVDVTNYVMLELGQPMHAFDADKIKGGVTLRLSQGERVTLLNHSEINLGQDDLVICDDEKIIALAGVMGGLNTAVSETTQNIFLESAYFTPFAIAGRARKYALHSDGAQRWERGVDPALAAYAMDRATQLILEIVGGHAGELTELSFESYLPSNPSIRLSYEKLCSVLGMSPPLEHITQIFRALDMTCHEKAGVIEVRAPSYRFDIQIPEDLIEEVVRVLGYDSIPEAVLPAVAPPTLSETSLCVNRLKSCLIDNGFHEVITYSFVDKKTQEQLFPNLPTQDLLNPISPDMSSMRLSIWPGLLKTLSYNQNRQLNDCKIFEVGQCFTQADAYTETLAGLMAGQANPLSWAFSKRVVDFFDAKAVVETLLELTHQKNYRFIADTHPALAPGQTAAIKQGDQLIGWVGALHPALAKPLDVKLPVFLFEINLVNLLTRGLPSYEPLSKFPAIRRDLAFVVDAGVQAEALLALAREKAGPLLQRIDIFDVYQGERLEKGKKSIALGLILQDSSRTLIDEEVNDLMQAVVQGLEETFQATVRE